MPCQPTVDGRIMSFHNVPLGRIRKEAISKYWRDGVTKQPEPENKFVKSRCRGGIFLFSIDISSKAIWTTSMQRSKFDHQPSSKAFAFEIWLTSSRITYFSRGIVKLWVVAKIQAANSADLTLAERRVPFIFQCVMVGCLFLDLWMKRNTFPPKRSWKSFSRRGTRAFFHESFNLNIDKLLLEPSSMI